MFFITEKCRSEDLRGGAFYPHKELKRKETSCLSAPWRFLVSCCELTLLITSSKKVHHFTEHALFPAHICQKKYRQLEPVNSLSWLNKYTNTISTFLAYILHVKIYWNIKFVNLKPRFSLLSRWVHIFW